MRAQFASGKLTALQRVKLLQELMQVSSGWAGTEGPAGRAAGWRAPCLRRDAELPAAPRCQRRSSLLPQAHERVVENHRAVARKSLMKVSRCSGTGPVWVCRHSSVAVGRGVGEVPPCGSAAAALWAPVVPMEEAGGDGGTELPSDGALWER